MKKTTYKTILIIITAATLGFIWYHSMMPSEDSARESGRVLAFLRPFLLNFMPSEAVTDHFVRKLAHLTEYSVLGMELHLCTRVWLKNNYILFALVTGLIVAAIDETIQIFSHRGAMVRDVCLDFVGVIIGTLIILIIVLIRNAKAKEVSE